jgi:hypothetical protein
MEMGWGGKGGGACLFVWAAMTLGSFSLHPHPPTHIHMHSLTNLHTRHARTYTRPASLPYSPPIHTCTRTRHTSTDSHG